MVPWLSKRKPASGFLQEDIEVGVIAWGNKLLGGASWFLGQCLNLHLVNPLQGSSLGFFVKGSEASSSILEHMTGTGAPVELYCALLPVYCRIMLPQPRIA